jgi:hypothetical protein
VEEEKVSRLGRIAGRAEAFQLLQRYARRGVVESRLIASPTSQARITLSAVPMPVEPNTAVAVARTLLGVPCRHQGRTRQGVDCAGLVVLVGRGLGLADYDTTAYGRRPEGQGFVQHFRTAMDGLPLPKAGAGDVLVFADAVSYAYYASLAIAFAEGPAENVLRIWADGKLLYDKSGASPEVAKGGLRFRFHPGSEDQLPDPLIEAHVGEGRAPAHRRLRRRLHLCHRRDDRDLHRHQHRRLRSR